MSGYIGVQPVPQATQTRDLFTATSGQTTFATGGYAPGFLDVYLNGVKLTSADFTATNGSDVVLTAPASLDDTVEVVAFSDFVVASFATVANTGDYNDLINTPAPFDPNTLATVATTGAYSDLSGTPALSSVATSGAYSDLSGTPTLATVATTGAYNDLLGKPTLGTAAATSTGDYATAADGTLAQTAVQPADLATVATTGSYTDLTNIPPAIPSGVITLWSGTTASVPSGWALCDGTNGTPDLRNRFVVGAGSTYSVGNTGGSSTTTLSTGNLPAHTHSFSATTNSQGDHSHSGTTSTDGAHSHTLSAYDHYNTGPTSYFYRESGNVYQTLTTSTEGDHSHTITTNTTGAHNHTVSGTTSSTGSGSAFDNKPPYYALAYIMKT